MARLLDVFAEDLKDEDSTVRRGTLIRPIQGPDTVQIMGMFAPNVISQQSSMKEFIDDQFAHSLVAVEPRTREHPNGQVVGFALARKEKRVFPNGIGISALFVHRDAALPKLREEVLLRGVARICMAQGQENLDMIVHNRDDSMLRLCREYGAALAASYADDNGNLSEIYTICGLPSTFGYRAASAPGAPKP